MNLVALKMLVGDRAKYIGILIGVTFASLLITQQSSIFWGLMTRTFAAISDMGQPQIWVMDPKVQFIDDVKPLQSTELYRVRGVEGIEWAVPLYKGLLRARLDDGTFQQIICLGLDDTSLLGGPPEMVEGTLEDLRRSEGVIVDAVGARTKLAKPSKIPGEPPTPLRVGDTLEINDHRAVVVGLCKVQRTFQSQPVVYTTFSRATNFAPRERKLLSFVLVGAKPGVDLADLCKRIRVETGLAAWTSDEFKVMTMGYFLKNTGIPVNFGMSVLLGFLVGTVIAGQTFYNFTLDNLKQFGALKAMGTTNGMLVRMVLLQALLVGSIGYGLGVGAASSFGLLTKNTELAFRMPWWVLVAGGVAVLLICTLSALISIRTVIKLEPAVVFK